LGWTSSHRTQHKRARRLSVLVSFRAAPILTDTDVYHQHP
jgi:hypothetical protein